MKIKGEIKNVTEVSKMMKLKTILFGTVILSTLFTLSPNADYAQRRQCDPSKEECPGRKIQQKAQLLPDNISKINSYRS